MMILINKLHSIYLAAVVLSFLFACTQNDPNNNVTQTNNIKYVDKELTIDTFSTYPPEIDGCSCYFSNDSMEFKKGEYIYINDYAQTSFLKINGVLTKFTQTDFKQVDSLTVKVKYLSDNYEMTVISIDGIQNGDETWLKSGTIKVTDKSGKSITKAFYGECGC